MMRLHIKNEGPNKAPRHSTSAQRTISLFGGGIPAELLETGSTVLLRQSYSSGAEVTKLSRTLLFREDVDL